MGFLINYNSDNDLTIRITTKLSSKHTLKSFFWCLFQANNKTSMDVKIVSIEVLLFKYTKNKQAGNITKGVRDVAVDIPGVLKIRKGTGILTVGLTGLSVVGDIKNNKRKTIQARFGII